MIILGVTCTIYQTALHCFHYKESREFKCRYHYKIIISWVTLLRNLSWITYTFKSQTLLVTICKLKIIPNAFDNKDLSIIIYIHYSSLVGLKRSYQRQASFPLLRWLVSLLRSTLPWRTAVEMSERRPRWCCHSSWLTSAMIPCSNKLESSRYVYVCVCVQLWFLICLIMVMQLVLQSICGSQIVQLHENSVCYLPPPILNLRGKPCLRLKPHYLTAVFHMCMYI